MRRTTLMLERPSGTLEAVKGETQIGSVLVMIRKRIVWGSLRSGAGEFARRAWMLALLFVLASFCGAQSAYANLTVTPVTWNVIGLDSNRVTVGPDTFQVGARVCNTGAAPVTNIVGTFVWDSANIYINLNGTSTVTARSLAAGACIDFYYPVTVTRTAAAFDTARRYRIVVTGDGVPTVSTPSPRELIVKQIISQARNSINSITGPSTVYVGQTYTYTLNASTATQGYEQMEAFIELPNVIFQVLSINTTYSAPAGATNNRFYGDACGWDNNPLSPTYLQCIGPANYPGGKVGGTLVTTYTVKILATGVTTASALILDLSGGSFHYNSDYGRTVISITSLPPPVTLAKTASRASVITGDTITYTLRLTNSGSSSFTMTEFVDTLPTSPAQPSYVPGSATYNGVAFSDPAITGATLRWPGTFTVPAGQTRDLTYRVVMPSLPGTYTNSAIARMDEYQIDTTTTLTDNAPATSNVLVQTPPNVTLNKSYTANSAVIQAGTELTYPIVFTNAGGSPATNFVITDPIPANTDFKLGSMSSSLGTTGLTITYLYSNNGGTTFVYTPVSGGGGAPAGFDRNVTHVRWSFSGSLSATAPNNTGSVAFTVRIR